MSKVKFISIIVALAVLAGATNWALAIDLTTFDSANQNTEQGRVSRYTTIIGSGTNHTACHLDGTPDGDPTSANTYLGAYDYTSYPGSLAAEDWWQICDGATDGLYGPTSYNWNNTEVDPIEQFIGYRFKRPASISEINWVNTILPGGGTFAAAPTVEVLLGGPKDPGNDVGTWTAITVTGLESYDSSFANPRVNRPYTITPVAATGDVWGVRLIGDTASGTIDTNGFVATTELQVLGDSSMTQGLDLSTNLALSQTPIYPDVLAYTPGAPENICDGDVLTQQGFFPDEANPTGPDWAGVLFASSQSNVAAVGLVQRMAADGGWFKPGTMDIQYLPQGDDPAIETNWVSVSNLDMGRWAEMEPEVGDVAVATARGIRHGELLTFDTISSAIDGIRVYGDSEGTWGGDRGFIAVAELEVFASGGSSTGIPGDTNDDDIVDATDAATVASNWGDTASGPSEGDFNNDGVCNAADASIMAANWGDHTESAGEASVPEPSTVIMLLIGIVTLMPRRRR